jgi:hypothetical protein
LRRPIETTRIIGKFDGSCVSGPQDVVGVRRWRVRCGLPTIRSEPVNVGSRDRAHISSETWPHGPYRHRRTLPSKELHVTFSVRTSTFRIEACCLLPRLPNLCLFASPRTGNSRSNPPRRIGIDLEATDGGCNLSGLVSGSVR